MEFNNDVLTINIDRNDEIFDILNDCPTDEDKKQFISDAIKLHQSCIGDGRMIFFPSPKKFGFELIRTSDKFLKRLREAYHDELFKELSELDMNYLLYRQSYEPLNTNEIKLEADGYLSRIALYYQYIKEIDKRLDLSNENKSNK